MRDRGDRIYLVEGYCLYALPAKRYAMTRAIGIRLKFIFETILKRNSASEFVLNVQKSCTQRFSETLIRWREV
jgi:hypothetical protein